MPRRALREILIALAGPAVNGVLAIPLFAILALGKLPLYIDEAGTPHSWLSSLGQRHAGPIQPRAAFPMDGGRILRALLFCVCPICERPRMPCSWGRALRWAFFLCSSSRALAARLSSAFLFFQDGVSCNLRLQEFCKQHRRGEFVDKRWFLGTATRCIAELCAAMSQNETWLRVLDLEGLHYGIFSRRELLAACLAMPSSSRCAVSSSAPCGVCGAALARASPASSRRAEQGRLPVVEGAQIVGILSLTSSHPALTASADRQANPPAVSARSARAYQDPVQSAR